MAQLRWRLAGDDAGKGALFDADALLDRHVGTGEFAGTEFLHVNAQRLINRVPASSRMPFEYTINAYRGCSHACVYCVWGPTPILMGDGRVKPISDVRPGDIVYGTERIGTYRRLVRTRVSAHWHTSKPAYEVKLADGTRLIASGDHRFLTERGWKHVTGSGSGPGQRPHLTTGNRLIGVGALPEVVEPDEDYLTGYLCGMIRGDGSIGHYSYRRPRTGTANTVHRFRLALADEEPLLRSQDYLSRLGVVTGEPFSFKVPAGYRPMKGIRAQKGAAVARIEQIVAWPASPSTGWASGYLAGAFDAEGSYSQGVLRIHNRDPRYLSELHLAMRRMGFDSVIEPAQPNGVRSVRLRGGTAAHLRFFLTTDPAMTRKRDVAGVAIKFKVDLRVTQVRSLDLELPMFDITTDTGDFIANGVVSHNCFARPTHEYLGLNIGEDFDRKIVVKINAVEKVRAELAGRRWAGAPIAMGTNTDPYQRCEGKYRLTRGIIAALIEARNPFSILTKSTLVLRDLDLLQEAARLDLVRVSLSIGTLDEKVWKETEPGTPHPRQRVTAIRRLSEAGIPCGVLVAPVIPGLSDRPDQVAEVVRACRAAGASSVSPIPLHLRPGVKEHYLGWLAQTHPELMDRYQQLYQGRSYLAKGTERRGPTGHEGRRGPEGA